MTDLRRRYFETLALPNYPPAKPPPPSLVNVLDRAHELRKFEIEHYWKRAQYFWGFQVAIFAAFGLLWKETTTSPWQPLAFALTALGLLTAIANTLSAAGSKFWQKNWEYHIDLLEDRVEGRLHKTIWVPEGRVAYSVSGVNQTLGLCFIAFWLTASAYTAWKICGWHFADWTTTFKPGRVFVCAIVIMTVIALIMLFRQTTGLEASFPEEGGKHGVPAGRWTRWNRQLKPPGKFVRRYGPDEQ